MDPASPRPRSRRHLPAAMLRDATRRLRDTEQYVEDLLVVLFLGWRPMHPRARGWRFSSPDAIDVYGVADSPEAVARLPNAADQLHRAGFHRVTAHPHDHRAPCRCSGHFPRVGVPGSVPRPEAAVGEGTSPGAAEADPPEMPEIEIRQGDLIEDDGRGGEGDGGP